MDVVVGVIPDLDFSLCSYFYFGGSSCRIRGAMFSYKGITGDLELPDWLKGWTYSEPDESLRCDDGDGDFDAIIWSSHSTFAMACAMLWRMESDRLLDEHNKAINCGLASDLIAIGFHTAYDKCLAWEKEAAARLEAERKVG